MGCLKLDILPKEPELKVISVGGKLTSENSSENLQVAFKYRVHNVEIGRFLSRDPLAKEYPHNSPYAFSENRVIDAIELEGAEMFLIHGTTSDPGRFSPELREELLKLTNNVTYNDEFSWEDLDHLTNDAGAVSYTHLTLPTICSV